jgi:hypothetical protein
LVLAWIVSLAKGLYGYPLRGGILANAFAQALVDHDHD